MPKSEKRSELTRSRPVVFPFGLSVRGNVEDGVAFIDFVDPRLKDDPILFSCVLPLSMVKELLSGLEKHVEDTERHLSGSE